MNEDRAVKNINRLQSMEGWANSLNGRDVLVERGGISLNFPHRTGDNGFQAQHMDILTIFE